MFKRWGFAILTGMFAVVLLQYFYSGDLDKNARDRDGFEVIAHRGVSQTYHRKNLNNQTCTATRIYKPRHEYLENTIESIQAAFEFGATMVEIDVRPTKDKQLVVFHDNTLDCRTEGSGNVWDYTVDELKQLDIGYGYTFDGGATYPFRGKGVGKIRTLNEILHHFPDRKFLIDNKSGNNLDVAEMLVKSLSRLPDKQQQNIFLWCQDAAYTYIEARVPMIRRLLLPRHQQKQFFKHYLLSMGMGSVDTSYQDQGLGLPIEYTKFVWGWPNRLLNKIYANGARFYLYINDPADLKSVSDIPLDGIITDNIDLLTHSEYLRKGR